MLADWQFAPPDLDACARLVPDEWAPLAQVHRALVGASDEYTPAALVRLLRRHGYVERDGDRVRRVQQ